MSRRLFLCSDYGKDYQNEAVSDMIERHEGIIMKEQINDYLHYLNIERGLSANTRQSYERDLEQYLHFLQEQKIASWQDVDRF